MPFAIVAAIVGCVFVVAGWVGQALDWDWCAGNQALGYASTFGVVCFAPMVATYTLLGLNHREDGPLPPATAARQQRLKAACPAWPLVCYTIGAMIVSSSAVSFVAPSLRVNALYVGLGGLSLISSFWFARVYAIAQQLFNPRTPATDAPPISTIDSPDS